MILPPTSYRKLTPFLIVCGLLGGVVLLIELMLLFGWVAGSMVALLPLCVLMGVALSLRPYFAMWLFILLNYYIMGLSRYLPLKSGMMMMGFALLLLCLILLNQMFRKISWRNGLTSLTLFWGGWLVYCVVMAFLPGGNFDAWLIAFNGYALIPFLLALLLPILFHRYRDLKLLILAFSILTLTAMGKALCQKFIGFDTAEKIFLYVNGGARTHLIWSGTRYFSIYTDAGNFGSAMAMAMVVCSIVALYVHKGWRIYYLCVAALAAYGLGMSGTRSAMIIPFMGYLTYVATTRRWKIIFVGVILLLGCFVFFKYTTYGQGNSMIRRMRSAFHPTEDTSFQVRMNNQARLRYIMAEKPFGIGMGLGGGKAKRFDEKAITSWIATDSWFVLLWVEMGWVGLSLYMLMHLLIIAVGGWKILFHIRDPQLQGLLVALLAGVAGMWAGGYANEIMNFPNGPMVCVFEAMIFAGPRMDRALRSGTADADSQPDWML
ncbi:MAG: O-antigen ligase family protein [Alistipes sp.]|nr:O-antigen ligase family protein [Alistipes sp.]